MISIFFPPLECFLILFQIFVSPFPLPLHLVFAYENGPPPHHTASFTSGEDFLTRGMPEFFLKGPCGYSFVVIPSPTHYPVHFRQSSLPEPLLGHAFFRIYPPFFPSEIPGHPLQADRQLCTIHFFLMFPSSSP